MRAILVHCGVVVKTFPNLERRPNYRLAIPLCINTRNVEEGDFFATLKEPKVYEFKYLFNEDETDVYTLDTHIISSFLYSMNPNRNGHAIKVDINAQEIVETVLQKRMKWMMSLFKDREVSPDEINVACQVMTQEIISEICI